MYSIFPSVETCSNYSCSLGCVDEVTKLNHLDDRKPDYNGSELLMTIVFGMKLILYMDIRIALLLELTRNPSCPVYCL